MEGIKEQDDILNSFNIIKEKYEKAKKKIKEQNELHTQLVDDFNTKVKDLTLELHESKGQQMEHSKSLSALHDMKLKYNAAESKIKSLSTQNRSLETQLSFANTSLRELKKDKESKKVFD